MLVFSSHIIDRKVSICLYTLLALEAACKLGLFIYLDVLKHGKHVLDCRDEVPFTSSLVAVGGLAEGVTVCGEDIFPPWQLGLVAW